MECLKGFIYRDLIKRVCCDQRVWTRRGCVLFLCISSYFLGGARNEGGWRGMNFLESGGQDFPWLDLNSVN